MNLVISPTLNERDNIDAITEAVLSQDDFSLLIVDDNSKDLTWQRVEELQNRYDSLFLLRRMEKPGFRNSYIDGFRWALEREEVKNIFTIDADLSHPPRYLPDLKNALDNGADMVIGSRYTKGGGVKNWSLPRRILSRNANRFAKCVTSLPVKDCTAGFNGIKTDILRKVDLSDIQSSGYAFLIELKHLIWRSGAKLEEVPIIFTDRIRGVTKFNSGMIKEAINACMMLSKKGKPE